MFNNEDLNQVTIILKWDYLSFFNDQDSYVHIIILFILRNRFVTSKKVTRKIFLS
jgi:hypothetical protein